MPLISSAIIETSKISGYDDNVEVHQDVVQMKPIEIHQDTPEEEPKKLLIVLSHEHKHTPGHPPRRSPQ